MAAVTSAEPRCVAGRLRHLDNLKVVLIAAIIALHGVAGYTTLDLWTYGVVREVTMAPASEVVLIVLVGPFAFFLIALLFLVAGLLTPSSVERKGPARFARDRLLRLGVPFLLYVGVLQPLLTYALYQPLGHETGSYWDELVSDEGQLDAGPLWFVGTLLVYSLVYAAWVAFRGRVPRASRPLRTRHLVVVAAVVAPATFLVRLVYPFGSEAGYFDLNPWQWPECVAMFTLGALVHGQGLADRVPEHLGRSSRAIAIGGALGLVVLLLTAGLSETTERLAGGANPWAAGLAVVETALAVFGPVWALDAARRRLDRPLWRGEQLGRAAYAAFIVQTAVLLAVAWTLRPVPTIAEAKALVVAAVGVTVSFALGAWLVRLPGLRRVL